MKRSGRLQNFYPTILTRTENSSETVFIAVTDNEENFPLKPRNYSSLLRMKRVLAWANRFVDNCRKQKEYRTSGKLLSDELKRAEVQLIRHTQFTEFTEESKALSRRKTLPSNSKLLGLQPQLDDDGLMRSDRRLKHAKFLSYDVRYPVLLPRKTLLANNGTFTNIETETITASIYQISSRFRGPIHYSSKTWKTTREEISLPVHLSSHKGCSFRDGIRSGHGHVPECVLKDG